MLLILSRYCHKLVDLMSGRNLSFNRKISVDWAESVSYQDCPGDRRSESKSREENFIFNPFNNTTEVGVGGPFSHFPCYKPNASCSRSTDFIH